jgi:hypothetical protein
MFLFHNLSLCTPNFGARGRAEGKFITFGDFNGVAGGAAICQGNFQHARSATRLLLRLQKRVQCKRKMIKNPTREERLPVPKRARKYK